MRPVGDTGLALTGGVRGSLLVGGNKLVLVGPPGNSDEIVRVLEARMGVEWSRDTRFGLAKMNAGWEIQNWSHVAFLASGDIGFSGPSFSVTLYR